MNSRGFDDFINSVCWELSGTRSLSLPSNQLRTVILSFGKKGSRGSAGSVLSWFAFAVTREWQLYGTSMFIRRLSPFLEPVLTLYSYSHYNCVQSHGMVKHVWSSLLWALEYLLSQFASSRWEQWHSKTGENQVSVSPEHLRLSLNMWADSDSCLDSSVWSSAHNGGVGDI